MKKSISIKNRWLFYNFSSVALVFLVLFISLTIMTNSDIYINFMYPTVTAVALIIISTLFLCFNIVSGFYFIKSVIKPIKEINLTAKNIAKGNYNIKINKKHSDEIGELCETINSMAQELSATEKIQNDFISSVSHELRTPLTAIKGWAETMQFCGLDEKETFKRGLDTIIKEAQRLSGIVEEMLDFSSLQNKRICLNKERIDMLAEIGEAVYMFRNRAAEEKKSLIYNEPKMLSPIFGDKNRLKQVFINIIDNALKYTYENGCISIDVKENKGTIIVSINDDGCGIPDEHLQNVVKKFYKANYIQRGSGIGLAIAEEIVTLHDGILEIVSKENFGTTVIVKLPTENSLYEDPK